MRNGRRRRLASIVVTAAVAGSAATAQQVERAEPLGGPADWFAADDYPPAALRSLSQGAVGFTVTVDAAGAVTGCAVTSSSGSEALDTQTCALMRARARFQPATAGSERPRQYSSRVRWTLPVEATTPAPVPSAALAPIEIGIATKAADGGAELIVGSDGIVRQCARLDRPYKNVEAPPDICSSYPVGARYGPPTLRNGKPTRRRVRIRISVESTALPGR